MKLVTFKGDSGGDRVGIWTKDDKIVDLKSAADGNGIEPSVFDNMLSLIEGGEAALATARRIESNPPANAVVQRSSVRLRAPIERPPRMRAISGYPRHIEQAAIGYSRIASRSAPDPEKAFAAAMQRSVKPSEGFFKVPAYWWMDHFSVSGPDDEVKWPRYSNWIDYELELVAIVGKRGRDIKKEDADKYLFGYTILNDLSARDTQRVAIESGMSITAKGKDFDGGYPMGPCIVTADALDIYNVNAVLRVNGEVWGKGHSGEKHWTYSDAIAYMSQYSDMIPGEVLSAATIPNCSGMENEKLGKIGDVVELDVEGIGVLRTKIV